MEDAHLVRIKELSTKLGMRIHVHLHETRAETEDSERGTDVSARPYGRAAVRCAPVINAVPVYA